MGVRVLSRSEVLNLRQKVVKDNFAKAEKIVIDYNPDLNEDDKNIVKLNVVKIFNLISNYNLKESEILPDISQLILNKQHNLLNEYYKDLSKKTRTFKKEIDRVVIEGVEKRNQSQTQYPEVFSNSNTVLFKIDEIIPLSKKIIDNLNYINKSQDEKNQLSLKESVISSINNSKQEKGVGYRLVYKDEEFKVNKFFNSKIKILDNLKSIYVSLSSEKKAEFVSVIQNLQYSDYHRQKKEFPGSIYKKFSDSFLYNVIKNFKLEEFEDNITNLRFKMSDFSESMKKLADKNDAISYDDVSDDNVIDMIEFSVSPYKIATASTYKNWESCMAINKNEHNKLIDSISEGEIIAYMINSKKPDRKISRTLLKPYKNEKTGNIYYKLAPFYGKQVSGLKKLMKSIVDDNFHTKEKGVYRLNSNIYNDKLPSSISVYDDILELLESNNIDFNKDHKHICIDNDLDLTKFGKLELNGDFPDLFVNGKVRLTEENVNQLSFSKLPRNVDGIDNLNYLGNLDKYSTIEVLSKIYGNNWANLNIKDKTINQDLDLRQLNIKSLPHDFSDYSLVGKMDLRGNDINQFDLELLPTNRDGILLSNIGDISDYTSIEFFSKVFGEKWVDENVIYLDDKIILNSDLKLNGMKITKLPGDFSDLIINGELNLMGNSIEGLKLSDLPQTSKGVRYLKDLGDVSDVKTKDFLNKINGTDWMNNNFIEDDKIIDSDLHLVNLGIKKLPADLSEYLLNGSLDVRINNFEHMNLIDLPHNIKGITGIKNIGNISSFTTKDFLSKTKGSDWVNEFYVENKDGGVLIDGDLKLDNYGITNLPKDFDNVKFINGQYSLWGNSELVNNLELPNVVSTANGIKGFFNFGDVSKYDTKFLISKTSGVDWYKKNTIEKTNDNSVFYVKEKAKLSQLGITKLPHDLNQYQFIKGVDLWSNKLSNVDYNNLPQSSNTSLDRDVSVSISNQYNNVESLNKKGISSFANSSELIVSDNDNYARNELIEFIKKRELSNQR